MILSNNTLSKKSSTNKPKLLNINSILYKMHQINCETTLKQHLLKRKSIQFNKNLINSKNILPMLIFSFIKLTSLKLILSTIVLTLSINTALAASSSRTSNTGKHVSALDESKHVNEKLLELYDNQITGIFFYILIDL